MKEFTDLLQIPARKKTGSSDSSCNSQQEGWVTLGNASSGPGDKSSFTKLREGKHMLFTLNGCWPHRRGAGQCRAGGLWIRRVTIRMGRVSNLGKFAN